MTFNLDYFDPALDAAWGRAGDQSLCALLRSITTAKLTQQNLTGVQAGSRSRVWVRLCVLPCGVLARLRTLNGVVRVCALTRVHIQTVRRVLSVRSEALHGQLQLLFLPAPELPLLVGADQGFHGKSVGSRAQSCGRSPPFTHVSQIHPTGGRTRRKTRSVRPTR